MADDLEQTLLATEGEGPRPEFVASLRERLIAEAERATATSDRPAGGIPPVEFQIHDEETTMTKRRWMVAAVAASTIALTVGLIAVSRADDESGNVADEPAPTTTTDAAPETTRPATTTAPSPAVAGADADAGCGLSASSSVSATVDEAGESVTFDVDADPSCAGVELTVFAAPMSNGFPIERLATLDETGAASISDHLLGDRRGEQEWAVELIVRDTGGVAATTSFAVSGVCDLEVAELEAVYLPETNEVDIVLTVDPACAGETFAFDRGDLFASSPPGGWAVFTVDESGRIETTEQLVTDRSIIDVDAMPAPAERGVLANHVARVTLDVSGE